MKHIWATCPACETEIHSDTPKPLGYTLPTTECIECASPLCAGTCKDTAYHCDGCGEWICSVCMAVRDNENPMCASCAESLVSA